MKVTSTTKWLSLALLLSLFLACAAATDVPQGTSPKPVILCSLLNEQKTPEARNNSKYHPHCTHFSIGIDFLNAFKTVSDKHLDYGLKHEHNVTKTNFPGIKLMIGIFMRDNTALEEFANILDQQKQFPETVSSYLTANNLDGIVWHFKIQEKSNIPTAKFSNVMIAISNEFKKHNMVSIVSVSSPLVGDPFDVKVLSEHVDYFSLWTPAELESTVSEKDDGFDKWKESVQKMSDAGYPRERLLLGLDFTVKELSGRDEETKTNHYNKVPLPKVCESWNNVQSEWDPKWARHTVKVQEKVYKYNSPRSMVQKVKYALNEKIGGMHALVDTDDTAGICHLPTDQFDDLVGVNVSSVVTPDNKSVPLLRAVTDAYTLLR